jgi:hypothetical protein
MLPSCDVIHVPDGCLMRLKIIHRSSQGAVAAGDQRAVIEPIGLVVTSKPMVRLARRVGARLLLRIVGARCAGVGHRDACGSTPGGRTCRIVAPMVLSARGDCSARIHPAKRPRCARGALPPCRRYRSGRSHLDPANGVAANLMTPRIARARQAASEDMPSRSRPTAC